MPHLALLLLAAAQVEDVTFLNASGGSTAAYLVSPARRAKSPAVLFVHWYDSETTNSNRTQFLGEAVTLAGQGVVSLLVDTMWSRIRWFPTRNPAEDSPNTRRQVEDLRRALGFLLARPGIDPTRVAFVGHDFGAMCGALLAGQDKRVSAWVLIAGTPSFSDWYLFGSKLAGEERQKVIDQLAPLDPVAHIASAAPSPVLFQFGRTDRYVPEAKAKAFAEAARSPKQILWYDAGHALDEQAVTDRLAWLQTRLKLK